MKAFYSILYVPLRPEAKELLSVGLVMLSEKGLFYKYSQAKLNVVKSLLSKNAFELLKASLFQIERSVNKALDSKDKEFFPELHYDKFSENYFSYLSRYAKNLLAFSNPEYIPSTSDEVLFVKLFKKLVSQAEDHSEVKTQKSEIIKQTKSLLKPKIESRVNWDFKVTADQIESLILPSIKVDFIGKNGIYVVGEFIDFTKKEDALDNEIAKQLALITAIKDINQHSEAFIIGKEPDKKNYPTQHLLWKNIFEYELLKFIDAEETEEIVEYVEEHDVKPLVV